MAKPPKLPKLGRFWRFGRALLGQPSEFYNEINFLGINCCSTYKKVSKDPHFISIYFREYEIHYYRAVWRYAKMFAATHDFLLIWCWEKMPIYGAYRETKGCAGIYSKVPNKHAVLMFSLKLVGISPWSRDCWSDSLFQNRDFHILQQSCAFGFLSFVG